MSEPTEEDFRSLGWNAIRRDGSDRHVFAQLLSLLGMVLVQIRDRLEEPHNCYTKEAPGDD